MDQENKSIRIKDNSRGMNVKEINERFLVLDKKIKKELKEILEEVVRNRKSCGTWYRNNLESKNC